MNAVTTNQPALPRWRTMQITRVTFFFVCFSLAAVVNAQSPVDVHRDIWPVLRKHCLPCHDSAKAEGQLRLDRKSFIEAGGHTGNTILGTAQDSELLRRLRSRDANYRMPKNADRLSEHTIQAFENWIAEGAPWPGDRLLLPDTVPTGAPTEPEDQMLRRALQIRDAVVPLAWPALLLLLLLLVRLRRNRESDPTDSIASSNRAHAADRLRISHFVTAILLIVVLGLWMFHRSEVQRLESEKRQLAERLERFNITEERLSPGRTSFYPQPDRPRHPRRLGGTYYRGNDERSPQLFNGGYYRTATMHLSLRDSRDEKLSWDDRVEPGTVVVCLEIERAPFATRELFRDSIMEHCRLTRHLGGEETRAFAKVIQNFQVIQPGDRWRATYPIGKVNGKGDESCSGIIYVCNIHGHAHYAIRYELALKDGMLAPQSELWMGATMFADHYLRPPDDVMSAHEWFGFLPIPEIEGGNTNDPDLLGIPEHQEVPTNGTAPLP